MSYSTSASVASYTKNILGAASSFSASTIPTEDAVNSWLSSGRSIIEATLSSWGYAIPVPEGSVAYDWVAALNTKYAVAQVELSRLNTTVGIGERTRGQLFYKMFVDELNSLKALDLSLLGMSRSTGSKKIYIGGISNSDKAINEEDVDKPQPRFKRGRFRFDGVLDPE